MPTKQNRQAPAPQPQPGYTIRKKDRNWAVLGSAGPAGVPDRLQARRGRGGAAAGGVTWKSNGSRGGGSPRLPLIYLRSACAPQTYP